MRTPVLVLVALLMLSGSLVRADDAAFALYIARMRRMHLNVDADRDGMVEQTEGDDRSDDTWAYGSAGKGAIVLANADDDDGDHLPDNWAGGDPDGSGEVAADERVNAYPDELDLAPLVVRKPGLAAFREGARIVLRIAQPAGDDPYYAAVEARERVRIFLPSRRAGDDLTVQAGDQAILGPAAGDRVEFVPSPGPGQHDIGLFAGDGAVHLGVEGIRTNSLVEIILECWQGSYKVTEDRVRMRVAPFLLSDNRQGVRRDPGAVAVTVEDLGAENAALRADLRAIYPGGQLEEARTLDRWHQDGYEIGYSVAPYGAMWVVMDLPRGSIRYMRNLYGAVEEVLTLPGAAPLFDPTRMSSLAHYARQHLLGPGVGLISELRQSGSPAADAGGNLEGIPPAVPGGPARYLYGADMSPEIVRFLDAQGGREGVSVDTSLLAVGHVDELLSYAPDGVHVLVADPQVAWALLLIASRSDPGAEMLQGMTPDPSGKVTVGELVSGTSAEGSALGDLRDYNLHTIMAADRLPALWTRLGIGSAASAPVAAAANRGTARLTRAGGLVGLMPDSRVRSFRLTFEEGQRFRLEYRQEGAEEWVADGAGSIAQDTVSASHTAFVLHEWWQGGSPAAGDSYSFRVDPTVPWVAIPVFYRPGEEGAMPLTGNPVNALVDGATIVTAQAHGPLVDLGQGPVDILASYVQRELERAGYRRVVSVDDRAAYHNHSGSVHCATNAFREMPEAEWWR